MSSVLIKIRRAIPVEEETRLMEAVHAALRAFKILPGDRGGQAGCDVDLAFKIDV